MKIDSTTIQLVLRIEDEGSISRAADSLNLAVAAASKRLTDLEQQLGSRIFKRMPHGVRATDAGLRILANIRQIDNLIDRLDGEARSLRQGSEGRIILGAPKAAIIQFLAADIARLRASQPMISLQLVEENSKIVQQLLRDKVLDIGIYEKTSGFLDLERLPYRSDQLALIYSRNHFSFGPGPIGIDELLDLPIVSLGKGSSVLATLKRAFRSRGRQFASPFCASGFDTMHEMVRHGLGVGLMPRPVLSRFAVDHGVAWADLSGEWAARSYVLSKVEGHAQAKLLNKVVEVLLGGCQTSQSAKPGMSD